MKRKDLPADSRRYSQQAFLEKVKWQRRQARMGMERKIEVLDRLLAMAQHLPKLDREDTRRPPPNGPSASPWSASA